MRIGELKFKNGRKESSNLKNQNWDNEDSAHFNDLNWSLLVKHLVIEDVHNSWLYCFTNPWICEDRGEQTTHKAQKGKPKMAREMKLISTMKL